MERESTDTVDIHGNIVEVKSEDGQLLARITADLPEGKKLVFNPDEDIIEVINSSHRAKRCTDNKWVHWGIQGLWDALVCVPAIAAAAPTTPIGQAGTAVGCHTLGSGLVTAIKC